MQKIKDTRAASDRFESTPVRLIPPTTLLEYPPGSCVLRKILTFLFFSILFLGNILFPPIFDDPRQIFAQNDTPADFSWSEKFETMTPTWRTLRNTRGCAIVRQERTNSDSHRGNGSEHFEFQFSEQGEFYLGHTLDYPWIIDEISPSLWIKSNAPGITVAAQIVLPRSVNPKTGRPITFLVAGDKYGAQLGQWERLGFDKKGKDSLAMSIERNVRVLRREMGIQLDTREQYIRQIVLFVEGDLDRHGMPSRKKIWIDNLEVGGYVTLWPDVLEKLEDIGPNGEKSGREQFTFDPINLEGFRIQVSQYIVHFPPQRPGGLISQGIYSKYEKEYFGYDDEQLRFMPQRSPGGFPRHILQAGLHYDREGDAPILDGISPFTNEKVLTGFAPGFDSRKPSIELTSQQLKVDNEAIGVRAIEYNGEPLEFLLKLGFNTVWISREPSPEFLIKARETGIKVICPPPNPRQLREAGAQEDGSSRFSDQLTPTDELFALYDSVLLWDLGSNRVFANREYTEEWKKLVRSGDRMRRPFICHAESGIYDYSMIVDILIMRREPLLTTTEFRDYAEWQKGYQRLARAGTPVWSTVQTQPDPRLLAQWELSGGGGESSMAGAVSFEQMQVLTRLALANGSHGILFTSNTPLTNDDPETRYRATALELLNLELMMIDEWFAKGRLGGIIESNRPEMSCVMIESSKSRLLLPVWNEVGSQYVIGTSASQNVEFRIPVPITYGAWILVPGGSIPLSKRQKAGGRQILLQEANLGSIVFLTQDPDISHLMADRARRYGRRGAALAAQLARMQLEATESVLQNLQYSQETGAIPDLQIDRRSLVSLPETQTLLGGVRKDIQFCQVLIDSHDYSEAYMQASRATQGLRLTQRNLWIEATRSDGNRSLFPVSTSFATIPHYISTINRLNRAGLGENRLVGGDAESPELWGRSGWSPHKHTMVGFSTNVMFSAKFAHSGQRSLQLSVGPDNPLQPLVQVETAPLWVTSPGMAVHGGEMICVNGWVNVPQKLGGTSDGLTIVDTIGGEALALRFDDTVGWKEFTFYRYVPHEGEYRLFFLLGGLGDAFIDDISVRPVMLDALPPFQSPEPPPGTTPFWRAPLDQLEQLNPWRLLPGNRER